MADKMNRTHTYNIVFEQIRDPEDILDVQSATVNVYAHSIDEAITTAWQTVTFNPDKYEITLVQNMNSRDPMYPVHF